MGKLFSTTISVIVIFCFSSPSYAKLYKWTDKDGKVHYSDKKQDQDAEVETLNADEQSFEFAIPKDIKPEQNPIIRPYEKNVRKLHLLDTKYHWKKESQAGSVDEIGAYFTGVACAFRGKMKVPDVFIHRQGLLPKEKDIAYRVNKIIKGLDYDSERTQKYDLLRKLERSGGLSLHSEIVEFQFNTCASSRSYDSWKRKVHDISNSNFRRHDIKLEVRWVLKSNRDQNVVYTTSTVGYYKNVDNSVSASQAILLAMESATLNLFSNQDFISNIVIADDNVDISDNPVTTSKPILADSNKNYRMLNLLVTDKHWQFKLKPKKFSGSLLFGDKCSARKELLISDARKKNINLLPKAGRSSTLIKKVIKEQGYSIEATISQRFGSRDDERMYLLSAELNRLKFEGCAPSLSSASKFVPIARVSTGKVTRKRVKVVIDWQLTNVSDQSIIYQTKTVGLSGSLLNESLNSNVIENAISNAASRLIADRNFIDKITLNDNSKLNGTKEFKQNYSSSKAFSKNAKLPVGIVNSKENTSKTIFLVTPKELLKPTSFKGEIGIYAYGGECRDYKDKRWPQSINEYPRNFISGAEFVSAQSKIIRSLAYKYQITDKYNVLNLQRKMGGLRLYSEIVGLRYDSCAPEISAKTAFSSSKISRSKFKHHRAIVTIKWKLVGNGESDVRYQGLTEGLADSWLLNSKGKKVLTLAIENATTQLFSNKSFVDQLIVVRNEEEQGFFSKLFSSSESKANSEESSVLGSYKIKAHTANVLAEISALKIIMTEFYMSNGEWPLDLSELGVSESKFSSDTVSHLSLQADGSILVELQPTMGTNKFLKLSPSENFGTIRWLCTSNISRENLVSACEPM